MVVREGLCGQVNMDEAKEVVMGTGDGRDDGDGSRRDVTRMREG